MNTNVERRGVTTIDTVIVGAGPAGLAVGACLARAGMPCMILEGADCVGSSWHGQYHRLHLHTVGRFSALPYGPFPKSFPRYPSRLGVIEYLEGYARQHCPTARFGEAVLSAQRADDRWEVETAEYRYHSRNLVIATGYNARPHLPQWPHMSSFSGTILHSSSYRNGLPFAGKRVLVVGLGNSGGEICIDLVEHGAFPSLAVRGGVNIVPRDPFGIPIQVLSILTGSLSPKLTDALMRPVWRHLVGDLRPYGLAPSDRGPLEEVAARGRIPVIDVGTVSVIRDGRLRAFGNVARFEAGGVVFEDGRTELFDAVILATGYRCGLESFLVDAAGVTDGRGYPLVSGGRTSLPGLYFCGFRNVATGLLRQISREARQISREIVRTGSPLPHRG
ncbi:MAG: NAD(P)/FAD-dependent oxidoreductase [Chloroflexota bacterium]